MPVFNSSIFLTMTYWAELFPVMYQVFNKVEMGYRLTTVGVNKNCTLVFVNFSAQDASILKISVPIIKRRSWGFQNTPNFQSLHDFKPSYGTSKKAMFWNPQDLLLMSDFWAAKLMKKRVSFLTAPTVPGRSFIYTSLVDKAWWGLMPRQQSIKLLVSRKFNENCKISRFLPFFEIHFYFIRKVPLRLRVISQFSHHYKLEDEGNVKELRNLRNVSNDPPT